MKTRRNSYGIEESSPPAAIHNGSPPAAAVNDRHNSPKANEKDIDGIMRELKKRIEEREELASHDNNSEEVVMWYSELIARLYTNLVALFDEQLHIVESQGSHVDTPRPAHVPPRFALSSEHLDIDILNLYDLYKKNKQTRRKSRATEASILGEHCISTQYRLRYLIGERIRAHEAEENERCRQARDDEMARRHSNAGGGLFGGDAHRTSTQYSGGGLFGSSPSTSASFSGQSAPNQSGFASFGSATTTDTTVPSSAPAGLFSPQGAQAVASAPLFSASGLFSPQAVAQQGTMPSMAPPTSFGGSRNAPGTSEVPFQPTTKQDGTSTITFESNTAMPHYQDTGKSFEELRFEDYLQANGGSREVGTDSGVAPFVGANAVEQNASGQQRQPQLYPSGNGASLFGSAPTSASGYSFSFGSTQPTPSANSFFSGSSQPSFTSTATANPYSFDAFGAALASTSSTASTSGAATRATSAPAFSFLAPNTAPSTTVAAGTQSSLADALQATTPLGAANARLSDSLRFGNATAAPRPSFGDASQGSSLFHTPYSDQAVGSVASTMTRGSLFSPGESSTSVSTPKSSNRGTKRRGRSARK